MRGHLNTVRDTMLRTHRWAAAEDMSYVETVRKAIEKHADFNEIHVTVASTTIACHCGPNCLGILFMTI